MSLFAPKLPYQELAEERERVARKTARSALGRAFVRWNMTLPTPAPDHFVWRAPGEAFPEIGEP